MHIPSKKKLSNNQWLILTTNLTDCLRVLGGNIVKRSSELSLQVEIIFISTSNQDISSHLLDALKKLGCQINIITLPLSHWLQQLPTQLKTYLLTDKIKDIFIPVSEKQSDQLLGRIIWNLLRQYHYLSDIYGYTRSDFKLIDYLNVRIDISDVVIEKEQLLSPITTISNGLKGEERWIVFTLKDLQYLFSQVIKNYFENAQKSLQEKRPVVAAVQKRLQTNNTKEKNIDYEQLANMAWQERQQRIQSGLTLTESATIDKENYAKWLDYYAKQDILSLWQQHTTIKGFTYQPLLSIVMPTYNTPVKFLQQAIESVVQQSYEYWELCIVDDASSNQQVIELLQHYAQQDTRIRVSFRKQNGHIAKASNDALQIAKGEYIVLLDHDDCLAPCALFEVIKVLQSNPQARIIYSDEDKIDEHNQHYEPYFKTAWNYDLFLSQNMISHLGVYQTKIVREIGGFRDEYVGSQDWDLALRVVEKIEHGQIIHIPKVLYHWRAIAGSTSVAADEKPYALIAAKKALQQHLSCYQTVVQVVDHETLPHYFNIQFALPKKCPGVSLCIVIQQTTYQHLLTTFPLLLTTSYPIKDVLFLDYAGHLAGFIKQQKVLQKMLQSYPYQVISVSSTELLSVAYQKIMDVAQGEYLAIIESDLKTEQTSWLETLMCYLLRPQQTIAMVSARVWSENENLDNSSVLLSDEYGISYIHRGLKKGLAGYFARAELAQQVNALADGAVVFKKSLYPTVKGIHPRLFRHYMALDFSFRLRQEGYALLWTPLVNFYRHGDDSNKATNVDTYINQVDSITIQTAWCDKINQDIVYSINHNLNGGFNLAWPPLVV